MHEVIKKYKEWKVENPEEDYQYDEIMEFIENLGRGETLDFLDWVENMVGEKNVKS